MYPHLNPRSTFDRELNALRDNIVRMSDMVDAAIDRAMQALRQQDIELARQVIADDVNINALRYEIEENCYRLLATQQPTARDMRSIVVAIHIAVEQERIADHAAGIAKLSIELAKDILLTPLVNIRRMAEIGREMMRAALNAYIHWDAAAALQTKERDDEVDRLDGEVYHELLALMLHDPRTINRATYLLWISHNLERIADRITNICERINYMVTGDVRPAGNEDG
jgi:phosphate transport system protein